MIDLSRQPCLICRETCSEILHRTTYPEYHYVGGFTMRRCNGCGLLFNSPRLGLEELGQLYGQNYYFFLRKDSHEFDRIVKMHQRTIGLLNETQFPVKRSIDIGCGRGYFPAVLNNLGWKASGIEISPDAAQYARSKFGFDVFTGTVEQYAVSKEKKQFPLVTAIDVIEHVPSPEDFVQAAASLVEPGGFLIIDTPNAAAANIKNQGVSWKGFNPFHIYLFSIDNVTRLLSRHGLSVEQSFSYGNSPASIGLRETTIATLKKIGLLSPVVDIYFGIKKLTSSTGSPDVHLAEAISKIKSEPLYLGSVDSTKPFSRDKTGDNIVVIARKN